MKNIGISDLVASVKQEVENKEPIEKVASVSQVMSGNGFVGKTESELNRIQKDFAKEIGSENVELTPKLQKIASEMEEAETVDDIVKIAEEFGGSEFGDLGKIASIITDIVISEIEDKIK